MSSACKPRPLSLKDGQHGDSPHTISTSALTDVFVLLNTKSDIVYKFKNRVRLNSSLASGYITPRSLSYSPGLSSSTSLPFCCVEFTAPPTFYKAKFEESGQHTFQDGVYRDNSRHKQYDCGPKVEEDVGRSRKIHRMPGCV